MSSGAGGGAAMGAGSGALSGASMGSMAGPWGAAIGALAGAVMGGIQGSQQGAQQDRAKSQAAMGAAMAANGNGGIPQILNGASQFSSAPSAPGPSFNPQGFDSSDWSFSMPPTAPAAAPAAPPVAGQGTANGMTQNPGTIPSVTAPSAIQQALASTAMTIDAISRNKPQQVQSGSGPHLFIPQGVRPPTLAAPIARAESPLQRYALMLRR